MTITDDIVVWARTRPHWQQVLLRALSTGQRPTPELISQIADELEQGVKDDDQVGTLDIDLPFESDERVQLVSLQDCKGVNALADSNVLEFGNAGLTVIYGDNGSGKSGYARLIKDIVGARHASPILPDVFEDPPDEPSATLLYQVGTDQLYHKYPGSPDTSIRKVAFYDEHCGDSYLSKKSTLTYVHRPCGSWTASLRVAMECVRYYSRV